MPYYSMNRLARRSRLRFESNGIPCRQIVVLRSCHVNEMPSHYLRSRCAKKSNAETSGKWVCVPTVPNGLNVGNVDLQGV